MVAVKQINNQTEEEHQYTYQTEEEHQYTYQTEEEHQYACLNDSGFWESVSNYVQNTLSAKEVVKVKT